jgi:hypothetical protein
MIHEQSIDLFFNIPHQEMFMKGCECTRCQEIMEVT